MKRREEGRRNALSRPFEDAAFSFLLVPVQVTVGYKQLGVGLYVFCCNHNASEICWVWEIFAVHMLIIEWVINKAGLDVQAWSRINKESARN
jgi:hypothetical protein